MLISMYMLAGSGGKYTKNKENTPAIELKPVTEASIYYGGIMYGGKGMRKFLLRIGALLAAAAVLATGSIALAGGSGSKSKDSDTFVIKNKVLVSCNDKNAEKLTVPDGVKEIGDKAFSGFKKLKTVTLPDSVQKIGKKAFAECKKLEKVRISKTSKLKEIGKQAFLNCKKLNTGFVPKNAKVAKDAFEGAGTNKTTPKPSSKPTPTPTPKPTVNPDDWVIKGKVLVECKSNARSLTVPDGVREIGEKAFYGKKNLKTVTLPDSVRKIGKRAFAECEILSRVKLGKKSKLEEIGKLAFLNCPNLHTNFVPDGVKVAKDAFEGAGTNVPTPTPKPVTPHYGGGGGGSGSHIPHSKGTGEAGPDYDLLEINELALSTEAMNQLTLGGEILALTLNGTETGEAGDSFTVSGKTWDREEPEEDPEEETEEEQEAAPEEGQEEGPTDTLVLTAEDGEKQNVWNLNGEVLRRMNKSGIRYLVFRSGDQIAALETEGFLAGWKYDEIKGRGVANRRFEYTVTMDGSLPAQWRVSVEGETYELSTDEHAGIYMTGVYSGSAEALDEPCGNLFTKD